MFLSATTKLRLSFAEWKKERIAKKKEQQKWQVKFKNEQAERDSEEKRRSHMRTQRLRFDMKQAVQLKVKLSQKKKRSKAKGRKRQQQAEARRQSQEHAAKCDVTSLTFHSLPSHLLKVAELRDSASTSLDKVTRGELAVHRRFHNVHVDWDSKNMASSTQQVFKCVDPNGVAYRNSPSAGDRSDVGVQEGETVVAKSCFGNWIQVTWTKWLPKRIVWDDGRAAMVKVVELPVVSDFPRNDGAGDECHPCSAEEGFGPVAGGGLRAVRTRQKALPQQQLNHEQPPRQDQIDRSDGVAEHTSVADAVLENIFSQLSTAWQQR